MQRNKAIDLLRGLALLCVIILHTLAYYLNSALHYVVWDYLQFCVPIFIFCSSYIFFKKDLLSSHFNSFIYLKKRFIRLLKPYLIFLLSFLPLVYIIEPKKNSFAYLIGVFTVTGGIDINWLVLLFLQFSLIFIFLRFALTKKHSLWWFFIFFTTASSIYLFFNRSPLPYRYIMWLPWSVILVYTYYFSRYETNKKFLSSVFFVLSIIYLLCVVWKMVFHGSLTFFNNKYPPNIYYLSYGLAVLTLLYPLAQKLSQKSSDFGLIFLSKYSYSLFFIHHIVIYLITTQYHQYHAWPWSIFFITVLVVSVLTQGVINYLSARLV